jgi:hypothetical protein
MAHDQNQQSNSELSQDEHPHQAAQAHAQHEPVQSLPTFNRPTVAMKEPYNPDQRMSNL